MTLMRKVAFVLLGLLFFACMATLVNAKAIPWPDWSQATSYVDGTGEAEVAAPSEDMTVCYVTRTETYLFFRVVFLGTPPPQREFDIYLDTVAGGLTGTDKGHSLHGLAPDYKAFYGSAPANLYMWNGAAWQSVGSAAYRVPDGYSVEIAVELSSIGNPDFPIGLLFISSTEADDTDWNANVGYLLYPRMVGGTVYPTQIWLSTFGAAGLLLLCAVFYLGLKRKQR